jgi:hypothetical protein
MLNPAVEKTLALLLLIGVGFLLRNKVPTGEPLKGIKTLILAAALPATIFLALLQIEVAPGLLLLPVLALGFNLLLLGVGWRWLARWDLPPAQRRTLLLLFGSLAPGLSCFPFIAEYLGESHLALAALADVGNKIFVLILLYLLAMRWHYGARNTHKPDQKARLRALLRALVQEPINLVLVAALVLLAFGGGSDSLPGFLTQAIERLGASMVPLVLIFIGLAVKLRRGDLFVILRMLSLRAAIAFAASALLVVLMPDWPAEWLVLAVAFPQSACSFWPYAHMSAVAHLEEAQAAHTFDLDLAVNVLALSLPISTALVLGICAAGPAITHPGWLIGLSLGCLGLSRWMAAYVPASQPSQ